MITGIDGGLSYVCQFLIGKVKQVRGQINAHLAACQFLIGKVKRTKKPKMNLNLKCQFLIGKVKLKHLFQVI